jgi:hypothetical protein
MARKRSVARLGDARIAEGPRLEAIKATIVELGIDLSDDWAHAEVYPGETMHGTITAPVRIAGLRLPTESTFSWDRAEIPELHGQRVDLYGRSLVVDEPPPEPYWVIPAADPALGPLGRGAFILQTWRRDVSSPGSPFVAQIDWRPGWTEYRAVIRGAEHDNGRDSDAAFNQARALRRAMFGLTAVDLRRGMTDQEALQEAVNLGREWLSRHPDAAAADFGRDELAAMKCVDRDSLDKWMVRKHFNMKKVHRKLV